MSISLRRPICKHLLWRESDKLNQLAMIIVILLATILVSLAILPGSHTNKLNQLALHIVVLLAKILISLAEDHHTAATWEDLDEISIWKSRLLGDRPYRIGTTMRAGLAFGPPTVAAVVEAAIPYRNGSST